MYVHRQQAVSTSSVHSSINKHIARTILQCTTHTTGPAGQTISRESNTELLLYSYLLVIPLSIMKDVSSSLLNRPLCVSYCANVSSCTENKRGIWFDNGNYYTVRLFFAIFFRIKRVLVRARIQYNMYCILGFFILKYTSNKHQQYSRKGGTQTTQIRSVSDVSRVPCSPPLPDEVAAAVGTDRVRQ